MRKKLFTLFTTITVFCVIAGFIFADTTTPDGHGSPVKAFGAKVGDPENNGTVEVIIKMKDLETGVTNTKKGWVYPKGTDGPAEKAKLIADKANELIGEHKAKGQARSGPNGEVSIELPDSRKPWVQIISEKTGEEDEEMSKKELDNFLGSKTAAGTESFTPFVPDHEKIYSPQTVSNEYTTTYCLTSLILRGNPSGTWNYIPGGTLNVFVGSHPFSTSTQGKTTDMLANEILAYYLGMGYNVSMSGDPVNGFIIHTEDFVVSIQAYDDTLQAGIGMESAPDESPWN